ncbi:hypothetical protein BKA64DRAFT_711690 [Cadophora sp. MPI-SDFR-AT-0126]|nr:hypothetical protein BKA64DRAFT_711690 [Leotiomycetes sp. MPI-SDFR-AT-0126]
MTSQIVLSEKTWNDTTRQYPALAFLEKYAKQVDSGDLSGPFYEFYAPSCTFYDTDGTIYQGGSEIWEWMRRLFGQFRSIKHELENVLFIASSPHPALGPGDSRSDLILLEAVTHFGLGGEKDESVAARRKLMFRVGKSEVEGQGTDGLQILEGRVWWDRSALLAKLKEMKST